MPKCTQFGKTVLAGRLRSENSADAKFCRGCGNNLEEQQKVLQEKKEQQERLAEARRKQFALWRNRIVAAVLVSFLGGGGYWVYQWQAEEQRLEDLRVRFGARAKAEAERAKTRPQVASPGGCRVVLSDAQNERIVTPYQGGCKGTLAEGEGGYTFSAPGGMKTYNGQFRDGKFNGTGTLTDTGGAIEGEFRDNRPWNAISRGVSLHYRYGYMIRDGLVVQRCITGGNYEVNCIDRNELLGSR